MSELVEAEHLRKCFGSVVAVDDISLTVRRGEVLGFLGPNGAGKSTTMKMISGFLEPDAGRARIAGIDVARDPKAAKSQLGYLPEGAPAYSDMTPRGFLGFIAEIRGFSGDDIRKRVDLAVARTGLEPVLDRRIEALSKGYKRRVGLAQAILHEPAVLIMDEPTDGLDPNQKHHVRELIRELAKDKAIIVSTHILEEVEAVCTRAVVIDRGRIVADGTADDLQRRLPYHHAVSLTIRKGGVDGVEQALGNLAGVASVERLGEPGGALQLRVIPRSGVGIAPEVAALLRERGVEVEEMFIEKGKLEDVFRDITSRDGEGRTHA